MCAAVLQLCFAEWSGCFRERAEHRFATAPNCSKRPNRWNVEIGLCISATEWRGRAVFGVMGTLLCVSELHTSCGWGDVTVQVPKYLAYAVAVFFYFVPLRQFFVDDTWIFVYDIVQRTHYMYSVEKTFHAFENTFYCCIIHAISRACLQQEVRCKTRIVLSPCRACSKVTNW